MTLALSTAADVLSIATFSYFGSGIQHLKIASPVVTEDPPTQQTEAHRTGIAFLQKGRWGSRDAAVAGTSDEKSWVTERSEFGEKNEEVIGSGMAIPRCKSFFPGGNG